MPAALSPCSQLRADVQADEQHRAKAASELEGAEVCPGQVLSTLWVALGVEQASKFCVKFGDPVSCNQVATNDQGMHVCCVPNAAAELAT